MKTTKKKVPGKKGGTSAAISILGGGLNPGWGIWEKKETTLQRNQPGSEKNRGK